MLPTDPAVMLPLSGTIPLIGANGEALKLPMLGLLCERLAASSPASPGGRGVFIVCTTTPSLRRATSKLSRRIRLALVASREASVACSHSRHCASRASASLTTRCASAPVGTASVSNVTAASTASEPVPAATTPQVEVQAVVASMVAAADEMGSAGEAAAAGDEPSSVGDKATSTLSTACPASATTAPSPHADDGGARATLELCGAAISCASVNNLSSNARTRSGWTAGA
mmetsp:Transcript_46143/g.98388  ORF Transcript_46143/g.98388 Transcript_46143/m.98388 type:complete len:230 (-) Transcript_46143:289-978(-)